MKKVLVIGDIIADVYRDCTFKKMCPDAPDVKAIVDRSVEMVPGGAANVALNLVALAPDVSVSLIGCLSYPLAREIKQRSRNRVSMEFCDFSNVITKERILLDGSQVLRLDNFSSLPDVFSDSIFYDLDDYLKHNDPDLIILSDYGSGTVSFKTLEILLNYREKLLVDTKMTDLSIFGSDGRRTRLIKLNYDEWKSVVATEAAPERFFESMVMTRGGSGAYLSVRRDETSERSVTHTLRIPGHRVETVDVCGCGDTFLAGLAASLLSTGDDFTAVQFANAAAATVVSKPRTSVADLDLTLKLLDRE